MSDVLQSHKLFMKTPTAGMYRRYQDQLPSSDRLQMMLFYIELKR